MYNILVFLGITILTFVNIFIVSNKIDKYSTASLLVQPQENSSTVFQETVDFLNSNPPSEIINNPPTLTLSEIAEQLDDVSEKVDILAQEIKTLIENQNRKEVLGAETINQEILPTLMPSPTPTQSTENFPNVSPTVSPETSIQQNSIINNSDNETYLVNKTIPKIIITEVAIGIENAENEFIELFNPNNEDINLTKDNFKLKLVSSNNSVTTKRLDGLPKIIKANDYFLLIAGNIGLNSDAIFSGQLTDSSGIIITDGENNILDKLSWGKIEKLPPESAVESSGFVLDLGLKTNQSLERKKENNLFIDTNNNSQDFILQVNPNPTNSLGETKIIEEIIISSSRSSEVSPSPTSSETPTISPTPKPTQSENPTPEPTTTELPISTPELVVPQNQIVINETMYNPAGDDYYYEFVELFNASSQDIDLTGWKIKVGTSEDKIESINQGFVIKSNGFAIIGDKPTTSTDKNIYDEFYSINCSENNICLQLEDAAFGRNGLVNTGTNIVLINNLGEIIDEVNYLPSLGGNNNDKSIEKINPCNLAVEKNWAESLIEKGSPGYQNSNFNSTCLLSN